jgi:hypothetical protein
MPPDGHNPDGTFARGNSGGPGRPPGRRRSVERDYLALLSEIADIDTWRSICLKAVAQALAGDAAARVWLGRRLLGTDPPRLLDLAADEQAGFAAEEEIEQVAKTRTVSRVTMLFPVGPEDDPAPEDRKQRRR